MLQQASFEARSQAGPMNSALVAAAGKGASPFQNVEQQACQEAAQAPGVSPASDASCAMEYSCSLPSTPAAKEQAQPLAQAPSAEADEPPPAAAFEGWFAKCRGCGCMTAHEKFISHADVPFCRRCQHTLHTACPAMQQKMVSTLLYVHDAWSNAGL